MEVAELWTKQSAESQSDMGETWPWIVVSYNIEIGDTVDGSGIQLTCWYRESIPLFTRFKKNIPGGVQNFWNINPRTFSVGIDAKLEGKTWDA